MQLPQRRTHAVLGTLAGLLTATAVILGTGPVPATAAGPGHGAAGTVGAPGASSSPPSMSLRHTAPPAAASTATGDLSTVLTEEGNYGYTAAGTGMRNLGHGTITITGVPKGATVKSATLIWDVLADAADPSFAQGMLDGTAVTGTAWASGASPCWPVGSNFSYQADVTKQVAGNGAYTLAGFASGEADGADPWNVGSTPPLLEGASLVVVYQAALLPRAEIQIAEGAAQTNSGSPAQATLSGFKAAAASARTTYIVADGQETGNAASFDGSTLPGVGFPGADPQAVANYSMGNLWDTVTADVGSSVKPGDTSATVAVTGGNDCLVWVGQVLSVQETSVGIYSDFKFPGQTTQALDQGWTLIGNVAGQSNHHKVRDPGFRACAAPWTGSTGSDTAVEHDLSAYQAAHPGAGITWESFWTPAVPPVGTDLLAAGRAAGAHAAQEIEQAYANGGLRPQYVVLDFEPSPQVVSCGKDVSPKAKKPQPDDKQCWDKTPAAHNCWQISQAGIADFVLGWQAGILTAVEDQPSVPSVYANASEYNTFTMWQFGVPVVIAVAGPHNGFPTTQPALQQTDAVLGYAAYYASCAVAADGTPVADSQIATVASWGGSLDTVQFTASAICPP